MIGIKITGADIPQETLDKIAKASSTKGLMKILGRRVRNEYREHFFRLDAAKPNKKGFPRQHFWNRIGKATTLAAADEVSATVAVSDPAYTAKVYGALVKPDKAKALAIPISSRAYGHSPNAQDNPLRGKLKLLPRKGKPSLLYTENKDKKEFHYVLLKSARIPADPDALPDEAAINAAVAEEISDYYERK